MEKLLKLLANVNLSKTQPSKITQSGRFLGRLFEPLMKVCLLLMKNVFTLLVKSMLMPLRLIAEALEAGARVHKIF